MIGLAIRTSALVRAFGSGLYRKSRQGLTTSAAEHPDVARLETGDQILPCKHVNECCDLWVSASHG